MTDLTYNHIEHLVDTSGEVKCSNRSIRVHNGNHEPSKLGEDKAIPDSISMNSMGMAKYVLTNDP